MLSVAIGWLIPVAAPLVIAVVARRDRRIHVVADGAYLRKTLRYLPVNVTLTGPLPRHAALWEAHPEHDHAQRLRRRGRPRVRGERIGNPDRLAAITPGTSMMVTRYGRTTTRTKLAVERTAPFGMLVQTLVVVW